MASGKGQSLCCPMVWSDWYGLKARLLAPEVKLVISVLYRCHTGSFALYTATSVLTTDLGRSIDSHCATLSSNESYGNFWIDEPGALPWTPIEPPSSTNVASFSLNHAEHAVKLKEFIEDSTSHRHTQGSKSLSPVFRIPHFYVNI